MTPLCGLAARRWASTGRRCARAWEADLHADDAELAEDLLDDGVVGERDALLVDLAVTALVDDVADGLERRVTVGHVRLDHVDPVYERVARERE